MTTPQAAAQYLNEHLSQHINKGYAVYNPHNKPIEILPVIYGFNNGGTSDWLSAELLAQDGTPLGSHICSHEGYMLHDLGILDGTRPDRHETFKEHYPDGYHMDFVSYDDVPNHSGLTQAIENYIANNPQEE